jgi:H+-transporting ATPase
LIAKQTAKMLAMGEKIYDSKSLPMLDPVTKQKPANLGRTYGMLVLEADGFAQMYPEHKVSF